MKFKISVILSAIIFLSAGCNFFQKAAASGVIKTVNGGGDWQFSNAIKDNLKASIGTLNVSKMDFDPQNHETVFVGGYNGGLYKSEDSGGSWKNILSKILVYDFAVSPTDSKTIYVAGLYADHGKVLKTTDGGATWQEIYNDAGSQNAVRTIAVNPASPNQILIGTDSGNIIKSADSGLSWQLAKNFDDRINRIVWRNGGAYSLLKTKGLFKTTDFGVTYQNLSPGTDKFFGSSLTDNITGLADVFNQFYVDPLSNNLIYVTTSRGLYKTTDEGHTWNRILLPVDAGNSNTRAIAVAQSSSNLVFTSVGATIYKSTDGGQSFQTQSINTNGYVNYILIDPQLPQIVYGGAYVLQ
jgi:photosystem II stability/assembly factor-like uncharacterized protein